MENPFTLLDTRLNTIENLILELQNQPEPKLERNESEKLLTVQEAAKFLKLSVATIYAKCRRRELPVMKRGKRLYFSDSELSEYLKGGRRKTQEEINDLSNRFVSESSKTNKR